MSDVKMKVSLEHLMAAIKKIQYHIASPHSKNTIDISITKEDPGSGSMIDCLTLHMSKIDDNSNFYDVSVEVYDENTKLDPIMKRSSIDKVTS